MSTCVDIDNSRRNNRSTKDLWYVATHSIHALTSWLTNYTDIMIHDLMSLKYEYVNVSTSLNEWFCSQSKDEPRKEQL